MIDFVWVYTGLQMLERKEKPKSHDFEINTEGRHKFGTIDFLHCEQLTNSSKSFESLNLL